MLQPLAAVTAHRPFRPQIFVSLLPRHRRDRRPTTGGFSRRRLSLRVGLAGTDGNGKNRETSPSAAHQPVLSLSLSLSLSQGLPSPFPFGCLSWSTRGPLSPKESHSSVLGLKSNLDSAFPPACQSSSLLGLAPLGTEFDPENVVCPLFPARVSFSPPAGLRPWRELPRKT